jgi:DUF1680 family protein
MPRYLCSRWVDEESSQVLEFSVEEIFGMLCRFNLHAWSTCVLFFVIAFTNTAKADEPPLKGLADVALDRVELIDGFWAERQKTHHEVTIPHALNCLEADGHVTNFDRAAGVSDAPIRGHHAFDSDLHKALEGALYCLQHRKDKELKARVDNILDRIVAAQGDDGFLISCYLVHNQEIRWENMRLEHQLYNAGHFFEIAVEHKRLTGGDKVLNAARRFADHIDGIFGPGKRYDVGGHEEVELALIKLYRATSEKKYLELCRFFLDERGHAHGSERKPFTPGPFVAPERLESQTDAEYNRARWHASLRWRNGRMQDHKPLVDQHEAIGHAVRAGYIYSAMADIARFMDAPKYEAAVEKIWEDVVFRKMYITGGLGTAQYHDEGFGDPYLLPNRTYCESCANIAHVFWQHRMNLLKGEAKYADVMELALYNGAISGIQLSGDAFFYQNPLESPGARRSRWIGLSCCPTNLTRIIPQVGGFAYAQQKGRIHVNLYLDSKATLDLEDGTKVTLRQTTDYPWEGKIRLTVDPQRATDFTLCLRIPGWAQGRPVPSDLYRFAESNVPLVTLKVNGKPVNVTLADDGYVHLKRTWQTSDRALSRSSDTIDLDLPMPFRRVLAHEKVGANRGKVALMRGPFVYCVEAVDHHEVDITRITLPRESELRSEHRPELLGGVSVVRGQAFIEDKPTEIVAVPYYAWCNREGGAMKVWIDERESQ